MTEQMLSNLVFLIIGVFDAFGVILLGLVLNMQPIAEYKNKILFICVWSTMISFIIRIVIDIPVIDLPLQAISFTLFYRYIMEYKYQYAVMLTVSGLVPYTIISLTVAFILNSSGVVDSSVYSDAEGIGVSILQVTSILSAYATCLLIKYLNIGWSYINRPPHDFNIKELNLFYGSNTKFLILIASSIILIALTLITVIHMESLWIFPFSLITFIALFTYSARRNDQQ